MTENIRKLCEGVLRLERESGVNSDAYADYTLQSCPTLAKALLAALDCLQWYGSPSNYDNLEHLKGPRLPPIDKDYGQRARDALAQIQKLGEG